MKFRVWQLALFFILCACGKNEKDQQRKPPPTPPPESLADPGSFGPVTMTLTPLPDHDSLEGRTNASQIHAALAGHLSTFDSGSGAIFDAESRTWAFLPKAPEALQSRGAAVVEFPGGLWVWGGERSGGAVRTGAWFDSSRQRWSALPIAGAPTERTRPFATLWNGHVVVFGGSSQGSQGFVSRTDGALYSLSERRWTSIPPLPITSNVSLSDLVSGAFAMQHELMYVAAHERITGEVYFGRFNLETKKWERLMPARTPRAMSFGLVPSDDRVAFWPSNPNVVYSHALGFDLLSFARGAVASNSKEVRLPVENARAQGCTTVADPTPQGAILLIHGYCRPTTEIASGILARAWLVNVASGAVFTLPTPAEAVAAPPVTVAIGNHVLRYYWIEDRSKFLVRVYSLAGELAGGSESTSFTFRTQALHMVHGSSLFIWGGEREDTILRDGLEIRLKLAPVRGASARSTIGGLGLEALTPGAAPSRFSSISQEE